MLWLKQSTVVTFQLGPFVDAGDGVTPETGLATAMDNATTGIRVSKNGAASIDRNSATVPAHDDDGYYRIALSATDTNALGTLHVQYEELAVTLPAWKDFMVVTANVWDSFFGADTLQSDLTEMGGVAQSATDLKDFADAGYDPATDKITGCLLTDTVTVNSDMRGTDGVDTATMRGTDGVDTATMRGTNSALLAASAPTNFGDLSIVATTGLVDVTQVAADKVWLTTGRTLTAFSTALALSVWDVLESAIVTASSIGLKLKNSLADTGEPGQGAPPVSASSQTKIDWLFKNFRNKKEQTTGEFRLFDNAGSTIDSKATVSDAAGVTTKEEMATGA